MTTCFNCGGKIVVQYLSFEYEAEGKKYIIPNVKTLVCCECGAKYYDEEGNKQIDEYKEG